MCKPRARVLVANVAVLLFTTPVPMVTPASWKVTMPVGVPEPEPTLTVAVMVTFWPKTTDWEDGLMVVVVEPWAADCVRGAEVLPALLVSPL